MKTGTGAGRIGAEPLRRFARAAWRAAPLVCFLLFAVAAYVFILSAGTWTHWRSWTVFYDAQAEGFRQGHLYLPEVPSAALRALPNPYDPAKMQFWRWDHVYYGGHFYVYWGLVPALFLAAFKAIFHVRVLVADDVIVFIFFVGRLLAGTLLIRALAARVESRPPGWAVWLALAVFAIAHPTPYLLARAGVYEGAILGGVCFIVSGLYLALRGIRGASPGTADRWLAASSVCFGLAGGTRISLLPTVVVLVCFTAFVRWRLEGGERGRLLRVGLAACAPAALLTILHLLLNRLRFGAWTEFGARYQLGTPLTVGWRFVLPDLFAYLFCPPTHSCTFPFLFGNWHTTRALAPSWLTWPVDHETKEPTIGLLSVAAFAWLAVAGLLVSATRRWARHRAGVAEAQSPAAVWEGRWISGALLLYVAGSAAPLLFLSASTMRYEADFASGVLLLATLFGWRFLSAPASRAGRATAGTLYVVLALGTVVASGLLGFTGYFEQFKRHNPMLIHKLEKAFSVCRSAPTRTPGKRGG
jgi:hypothetical protein